MSFPRSKIFNVCTFLIKWDKNYLALAFIQFNPNLLLPLLQFIPFLCLRAMDWIVLSPQPPNLYVKAITTNVMVFEEEDFGRLLGLDEIMRVQLLDGISDFIKRETETAFSLLLPCKDAIRRKPPAGQEESFHRDMNQLASWSWAPQPPEIWSKINFWFLSHLVFGN